MLNAFVVTKAGLYPIPQAEFDEVLKDPGIGSSQAAAKLKDLSLRPAYDVLQKMNDLLLAAPWSSEGEAPAELIRPEVVELLPQAWIEECRAVPLVLLGDDLVTAVESVRDGLKLWRKVTKCLDEKFGIASVEVSRRFLDEAIQIARSIRRDSL